MGKTVRGIVVKGVLSVALAAAAASAFAVDVISFTGGSGRDASIACVGIQWDRNKRWLQTENWHLNGYWDLTLAGWFAHQAYQSRDIANVGFTPVFRWEQNDQRGFYIDAGIGANLISGTQINYSKRYSTAFQFGDQAGVGYRFGDKREHDLQLQIQHLSNGGIKEPNHGINFYMLRYQYHF